MNKPTQFAFRDIQDQFDIYVDDILRYNEEKEFDLFINSKTYYELCKIGGAIVQIRGPQDAYGKPDKIRDDSQGWFYGRIFYKDLTFNIYLMKTS